MSNDLNIRLVLDGNQFRAELRNSSGDVQRFATDSARSGAAATSAFDGVRGAASSLRSAIAGVSVVLLVRQLGQMADTAANLRGRLALVTDNAEELTAAQSALFAISQRTSTSLESTVTLYTRMAGALREAGAGQREMLGITETISQALAVSGASSAESSSAVLQLSQAMAAGALRGEEFNSVNEAAPRIMQALAASMGVSRGELRKLAEEGKITTAELRRAFSGEQAAQIAAEFERLPLTIGRAFTQLSNAALQTVGDIDQASGASSVLASGISVVAQAVELLSPFVVELAQAWTGSAQAQLDVTATARDLADAVRVVATGLVLAKNGVDVLVDGFTLLVRVGASAVAAIIETFEKSGEAIDRLVVALKNPFDDITLTGVLERNLVEGEAIFEKFTKEIAGHAAAANTSITANVEDVTNAFEAANKPLGEVNRSFKATGEAAEGAATALVTQSQAAEKVKVSAASLVRAMADLRAMAVDYTGVSEPMRAALEANAKEAAELSRIVALLTVAGRDNAEVQRLIAAATANVTRAAAERVKQARLEEDVVGALTRSYAEQLRLAGMSEEQRRVETASLAAIAQWRAAHGREIDAETEAMIRQTVAAGEAQISLAATARQAAEDSSRAWSDFAQGLGRAVLDGAGGVKRYFKQLLDDLKAQIISSGLMNLFRSIFNLGGSSSGSPLSMLGAMFGGGGAGGGGISFGSIMSAFGGQSGGTGGGILSNLFSAQSWARAGQQLAGGFTSMMGGAGNVSALQSYGVLNTPTGMAGGFAGHGGLAGWGGAAAGALYGYGRGDGGIGTVGSTLAGGVAGYYAGGVMAGAAAGGMAGAGAAMAAIPVAGWIAAAALAIDALTGGKLFGTRYRPESSTSTLSLGDDGGDASMSVREVRQRSLFRGRRWRTRDLEAGEDAEEAADQLYDSIYSVMAESARSLAIDTPPMIDAAIRTVTEYDKKGKAKGTKIFVDILGRTWEEATAELAASRLSSEAIIATIDAALGTTVEAALAGIDEGIDRASPEFRERIGEMIGELIPKDGPGGTGTVGEASAIAERWRSDAELLAEGAQFLLMAATDIRRGTGLLGEGGTLTQIADLIEDLQAPGESLAQTYARVAASTALLDEALALSRVSLEGTREQFVRLATDVVEAMGGLDRAAALVSNYANRFYTDAERARVAVTQARANAATQFADIDLDYTQFMGEGGTQAFREMFERLLPTLSADAIAQWYEAAEALGIVIDATDAYVASMTAQARAQASIIGEINAGIADLTMTDYERQVAGIEGQTRSYVEALVEAGLTMEQATTHALRWRDAQLGALEAQRQAARTSITEEMADSVADVGRTDWERQMVGLDRRAQDYITALVETGVALDEATAAANAWRDSMRAALEDQRRSNFIDQLDDIEWEQSLAGMSAYDRQVATINRRYDELYATAVELGLGEDELLRIRRLQRGELDALASSTENASRALAQLGLAMVDAGGAVLGTEDARRTWTDIIAEATGVARGDSMSAEQRAIAQVNERFQRFASSITEGYQQGRLGAIIAGNVEQFDRDYLDRISQLEALRIEALANLRNDLDQQRFEREEAWVKRLLGLRDSLLLDEQLSTLTPTGRLSEAERQYAAAVSAIEAAALTERTDDDEAARGAFDSVARQMLREGRAVWGSAQGYTDLLQRVLGDIDRWVQDSPITIGQQIAAQAMQVVIPEGSIQLYTQPVEVLLTGLRNDQDEQTRAMIEEMRAMLRLQEQQLAAMRQIVDNTRGELMPVRAV